jgi:hypothetical protein
LVYQVYNISSEWPEVSKKRNHGLLLGKDKHTKGKTEKKMQMSDYKQTRDIAGRVVSQYSAMLSSLDDDKDKLMSYDKRDVEVIKTLYNQLDVRTWPYYTITMPLLEGQGPATNAECDQITYEVWDHFCNSYGNFEYLPDAINEAMRLTNDLLS